MKLAMKQKVFSLKERFSIADEEGSTVYEVAGKLLSWGHKLTITDQRGDEVAHISQKVISLTPKYFIEIAGQDEMELHGHITLFKPHYTLKTADGEWDIRGDFMEHEYAMRMDKAVVASVTKKWLSWGDTYLLETDDQRDALTALCVMLALDCIQSDTDHAVSHTVASSTTGN